MRNAERLVFDGTGAVDEASRGRHATAEALFERVDVLRVTALHIHR